MEPRETYPPVEVAPWFVMADGGYFLKLKARERQNITGNILIL